MASSNDIPASDHDIIRVRAEIEAEAEALRREDPDLAGFEREIERTWADIAPIGATGDPRELLLDRAERLSVIDANVPVGSRRGIKQIKLLIRKAIYWYIRYVTDAFNVFTGVLVRLLRNIDERLVVVEDALRLDDADLLDFSAEVSPETADQVARIICEKPSPGLCLVLSCGEGTIVDAIQRQGGKVYGIEHDPQRIMPGVQKGLDLRVCDAARHLRKLADNQLAALVFAGVVESLPLSSLWSMVVEAKRVLKPDGRVVVAVADPGSRGVVEADIRSGRGIAQPTWQHLLKRADFSAQLFAAPGPRISQIVVAELATETHVTHADS